MSKLPAVKLLCVAALVALAGCNSVGDGTAPEKLRLLPAGSTDFTTDVASTSAFECIRSGLQLIVQFTDGRLGDFTNRARFSSSNEAVLKISNGDIPFPGVDGAFLGLGTLVPQSVGTATITATYVGLQTSINVTVRPVTNLVFGPLTVQNIAPLTTQQFFVTADADGRTNDVTTSATWTFVTPDTTVATIGVSTGLVSALKLGGPLTVQAEFPACGRKFTGQLSVSPIKSLSLQHQPGFTGEIVKNTTESFTVMAAFRDDPANPGQDLPEQDLSTQAFLTSTTLTTATPLGRFLSALAAGTTTLTASFDADRVNEPATDGAVDPGLVTSAPPLQINVVDATLQSIAISPENKTIVSLTNQPFSAVGNYGNGKTQDITRHVLWTADDGDDDTATNPVVINSGTNSVAGIAQSRANTTQTVVIKATVAKTDTLPEINSDPTNLTIEAVPPPP